MQNTNESFWVDWIDPADETLKYLAVSAASGHYWTDDTQDPNIVDGSLLEIKYTEEDTMQQIGQKWKMPNGGRQYERHNLIKHPNEHAWLAVMKLPSGERTEDNKLVRTYQAFWSRKFKNVVCISKITGKCQGNPTFQDKDLARASSAKAKIARKKKLETLEAASKRLNFNPSEQLIAWAQGDEEKLNTRQPITNAQRIKCLEILAGYSWAKPKSVDPMALEKAKQSENTGPTVHVTLPSNTRELSQHVISHQDSESLDKYFKDAYKEPDEVQAVSEEAGEYDEEAGGFTLPDNGR